MVDFGGQDELAASLFLRAKYRQGTLWDQAGSGAILLVEMGQPRGWLAGGFDYS
jgi:hypothetical protein